MIVSIKDNRFQIFISSSLGFIYFYFTKNEALSVGIVILLTFLLRKIKIDERINKILKKN